MAGSGDPAASDAPGTGSRKALFRAARWTPISRFLVLYLGILLVSTVGVSLWVGQLIEAGIVSRTGAVTALYIDSVIGPHLQSMQGHTQPSGADTASINAVLGQTDLGRSVV